MRKPVPIEDLLACTLRFLATGESYASLEFQFRISDSTLANRIPEVCQAIYAVLGDHVKCPTTEKEWQNVIDQFWERWQFPNCLGAGDGKHIRLICPSNTGSDFYCFKGFFSLVLMAFIGPNYEFLYFDVGCQGSLSDGGIFRRTTLFNAIENNTLGIPPPKSLPKLDSFYETSPKVDNYFVCDDAFPLGRNLLKPFPNKNLTDEQRIFNYRLSRARRISENAFGILATRFRIFYSMITIHPDRAKIIVRACCALHNLLLSKNKNLYTPKGTADEDKLGTISPGSWRKEHNFSKILDLPKNKERYSKGAQENREIVCNFVNGEGSVPWQWKTLVANRRVQNEE